MPFPGARTGGLGQGRDVFLRARPVHLFGDAERPRVVSEDSALAASRLVGGLGGRAVD